ncbi:MAG: Rho termination factor N-terminal domain-containing protein [Deltaproteobacteria bacterium]|nr:MAG: Rho termination factor N-terminal domain-containing protein [Deltaproteobacteria bacterium]
MSVKQLQEKARNLNISGRSRMNKAQLVAAIHEKMCARGPNWKKNQAKARRRAIRKQGGQA